MRKLIVLISLVLVFSSCSELERKKFTEPSAPEFVIPSEAIITKEYDKGWVEFELDGHTYLYQSCSSGNFILSGLTLIK